MIFLGEVASIGWVGLLLQMATYTSMSTVSAVGFLTLELVGAIVLLEIFISGLVKITGEGALVNVVRLLGLVSLWNLAIHFL